MLVADQRRGARLSAVHTEKVRHAMVLAPLPHRLAHDAESVLLVALVRLDRGAITDP